MSLETYTGYIPGIVETNPLPTDPVSAGDDHLRGIKLTLATQFSGFTEPNTAVTVTASQINDACAAGQVTLPGTVVMFASNNVPQGWLRCNGAAVSRTTYVALFNQIGTTWGAGDGTTTFLLPDMQGYYARGVGIASSPGGATTLGGTQTDDNKGHGHGVTIAASGAHVHTLGAAGAHSHTVTAALNSGATTSGGGGSTTFLAQSLTTSTQADHNHTIASSTHTHTATTDNSGGLETRPYSKLIHFIIKT